MIKTYTCTERKEYTEKGRKKYRNKPSYQKKFDVAIETANKKAGIEEPLEQTSNQHSPQRNFEIKRKKLVLTNNSVSSNHTKDTYVSLEIECNNQSIECTSTPNSASTNDNITEKRISLTPARKETQRRSMKRSRTPEKVETKRSRQSNSEDVAINVINNNISGSNQVTPCNSGSESDDDLPAVSISQTPSKGYSSLKDIQSKDLVWVKHNKDPYWPALVMKDGSAKNVAINFFAYDGPQYLVKNKKKILPYFCAEKEQFEEEKVHNPGLMQACNEALWLLRSGKKECGSTADEQYDAIKKRRAMSQVTPCKRMTFTDTDDGSSSSSDDEPMESAFGYDITVNRTNIRGNNINGGVDEDSPKTEVVSKFPKGSPYSFDILKENFIFFEKELYSIFKGEIDSENHRIFFQGTSKERNRVQIQNRCGPLLYLHIDHWKELQDMMVAWVKKWSRDDNIKELIHEVKYVSDVMFPEATVRTMMRVEQIRKEEAWGKFLSLDSNE